MRKGIVLLVMMCAVSLKGQAQIYGYDQAIKLPTAELYDMNMMNAYANALRETAGTRMQAYRMYCDYAITALSEKQWNNVIYYVDKALDTGYYSNRWETSNRQRRTIRRGRNWVQKGQSRLWSN